MVWMCHLSCDTGDVMCTEFGEKHVNGDEGLAITAEDKFEPRCDQKNRGAVIKAAYVSKLGGREVQLQW